ncbi:MAG: hypothetical protein M3179_11670 [Actinomycetota bacterium]|nr:hypothetical protein [Actinomycetota bacterium]
MSVVGRLQARAKQLPNPKLESLFVAVLVLYGFRLGATPIGDNSMLTHLRTGIDMVEGSGIPRVDPYSWTAAGDPWVVQSWLPEGTYGLAHKLGGFHLVVLQQAVLLGLLAWLMARLARAGSPLRTVLAAVIVIGVGSPFWAARPLTFGLICMALTVLVVERRMSPWLLIPILWFWVQSHGSFLLAGVWLGARAVGEWADWRSPPRESLRYLGGFVAGLAVSVLNPLGAKLLTFAVTLGGKRTVFEEITEWRSPNFQGTAGRMALIFLAVALFILLRTRLSWRDVVPSVVFLGLALVAARNIPVLAIVLAAPLGRALRRSDHASPRDASALPPATRLRINRAGMLAILAAFVVFTVAMYGTNALTLRRYPAEAVTFLSRQGLLRAPHRLANQDYVGNYLIFRFGDDARVFIDDRYDMYPLTVSNAFFQMTGGGESAMRTVDRYRVDVVIWDRSKAFPLVLEEAGWNQVYEDPKWVVLQRGEGPP